MGEGCPSLSTAPAQAGEETWRRGGGEDTLFEKENGCGAQRRGAEPASGCRRDGLGLGGQSTSCKAALRTGLMEPRLSGGWLFCGRCPPPPLSLMAAPAQVAPLERPDHSSIMPCRARGAGPGGLWCKRFRPFPPHTHTHKSVAVWIHLPGLVSRAAFRLKCLMKVPPPKR